MRLNRFTPFEGVLSLATAAAVLLTGAAPARAQVHSVTLGITMNCPYGLGG